MAMPISNTHLRLPRGFGALLEGLTREILRDQPKNIPKYAAEYFEILLKQREDRGTDPSEWAASLEDRYYNNHSFKTSDHASRKTVSLINKNTQDSTAEDYSGHSEDDALVTMKAKHLTTSEEKLSPVQTQAESANGPPVTSQDPTASTKADGSANEINNSAASNQNNSESESHEAQLLREIESTETQKSDTEGEDDDAQEDTDQEDEAENVNISDASDMEEDAEQKDTSQSSKIRLQDRMKNEKEDDLEENRQDDDNEENISNQDRSKEESVDVIDTVHRSTGEADHLVGEDTNEGEVYQEIERQKSVDNDAASDFTESNVKISEEQGEILEKVDDDLSEEEDQFQEETLEKYFTAPQDQHSEEEELVEEGLSDSEVKEGHSSHNQENVNPDLDDWPDKEDTGLQEEQQDTLEPEGQTEDKQEECSRPQEEEDIMDIPLDDPEANRAAAKIQAGFRGHMTRKKMKPEDKTEGEERQEDRGQ